jgi:hypothetical protein
VLNGFKGDSELGDCGRDRHDRDDKGVGRRKRRL